MTELQRARAIEKYLKGKAMMAEAEAELLAEHEESLDKYIVTTAGKSTYVDGKAYTTVWDRKRIERDYADMGKAVPTCEGSGRRASIRVYPPKEEGRA